MQLQNIKHISIAAGISVGGTLLCTLAAALTLKNLGAILSLFLQTGSDLDFVAIFSQLSDARLGVHILIPLLLWGAFAAMLMFFTRKHDRRALRITLTVLAGLSSLVLGFIAALLLTRVNGVRFIDLLRALIPVIGSL